MSTRITRDRCRTTTHRVGCECHEAGWQRELDALRAERDNWKDEYGNLCKFANDYESQRDALRARVAELEAHKRLLFEENGRLLQEKESGIWDSKHPVRLAARQAAKVLEDCRECECYHRDARDWVECRNCKQVEAAKEALRAAGVEGEE